MAPLVQWLLGELGVPLSSFRSFVVDNTEATYGEDGGRFSHCSWVAVVRLRYATALLQSGAAEIYVSVQHNSGPQSPVALVQARSNARAKQPMQLPGTGVSPSVSDWVATSASCGVAC